jgi:hypothetical protein
MPDAHPRPLQPYGGGEKNWEGRETFSDSITQDTVNEDTIKDDK